MTTARKAGIVRRAAVPVASEIREGLDNFADALRTLAGAICTAAAATHSKDYGAQRDMGGVFYMDAASHFGDVLKKMEPKERDALNSFIANLCKTKR